MSPIPKDETTTAPTAPTAPTTKPAASTARTTSGTSLYRLTRGVHGRHEADGFRVYSAKSPETANLRLTDEEAAKLGDRVTPVDEGAEPAAGQYTEGVSVTRVEADSSPGNEVTTGPPTSPGTAPNVEAQKEAIKEVQEDTSATPSATAKVAEGETPATATTTTKATPTTDNGSGYGLDGMSWSEAKDVIMALETPTELKAAKKEEESGKGRKSVLDAIDARAEQLKA